MFVPALRAARAALVVAGLSTALIALHAPVLGGESPPPPTAPGTVNIARGHAPQAADAKPPATAEERIRAALAEPVSLDIHEAPFNQVVDRLAAEFKINLVLDQKGLQDVGFDTANEVTLRVSAVTLHSALNLLLRRFDLAWTIDDEVVLITTPEEAEKRLKTVVYDVTDLVQVRDYAGQLRSDLEPLTQAIVSVIEPTTWDQVGGAGSIQQYSLAGADTIVVSQTCAAHERIADFLRWLRTEQKPGARPPMVSITELPYAWQAGWPGMGMGEMGGGWGGMPPAETGTEPGGDKPAAPDAAKPAPGQGNPPAPAGAAPGKGATSIRPPAGVTLGNALGDAAPRPTPPINLLAGGFAPSGNVSSQSAASARDAARLAAAPTPTPKAPASPDSAAEAKIREALGKPAELDFHAVPLADALQSIQDRYKVQIVLDRYTVHENDMRTTEPVTLRVKGVTLESALNLLLRPRTLIWAVRDGVLQVTGEKRIGEFAVTRTYDVSDLVMRRDPIGTPWPDYDGLASLITGAVAPTAWTEQGGFGTIQPSPLPGAKALVISQTPEVHDQIAALLAELRAVAAKHNDPDLLPIKPWPMLRAQPSGQPSPVLGQPMGGGTGMF